MTQSAHVERCLLHSPTLHREKLLRSKLAEASRQLEPERCRIRHTHDTKRLQLGLLGQVHRPGLPSRQSFPSLHDLKLPAQSDIASRAFRSTLEDLRRKHHNP